MPKSNFLDDALLALIFQGTAIPNIADDAAGSPLTQLWCALHTADPTAAGTQDFSEAAYGGYARIPVARSGLGWTAGPETMSPVSNLVWPICTSAPETELFWSVGVAAAGATEILYYGPISPPLGVGIGTLPTLLNTSEATES